MEAHGKMYKASSLLGVHPNTIRKWEKEGNIITIRVGKGHRKVPETEINRIISGENLTKDIKEGISEFKDEKTSFLDYVFKNLSDDWDLVKKAVLVRDNYQCTQCGSKGPLGVHKKDDSGGNDPENLATLCQKCHAKLHAKEIPSRERTTKLLLAAPLHEVAVHEAPKPVVPTNQITRSAILDALSPSGIAQRAAFGEILSAMTVFKKFTVQDLLSRAKCSDIVAKTFLERMESLGYIRKTELGYELTVEVVK